jgi:hypothetical protein
MQDVQYYATWAHDLPQHEEALEFLVRNGFKGVETSNVDEDFDLIRQVLGVSSHVPDSKLTQNLASPYFMTAFQGERGQRMLEVIRLADDVSFHLGYCADGVIKNHGEQDLIVTGQEIDDPERLANIFIRKILNVKEIIRDIGTGGLGVEALLLHAASPEIRRSPGTYLNAGRKYITEYFFIKHVLDKTGAWFLADTPHWITTATTLGINGRRQDVEKYISEMVSLSQNRTPHSHVNMPLCSKDGGKHRKDRGLCDYHLPFEYGAYESDWVLEVTKQVIEDNPGPHKLSLEIYTSGSPPVFLEPMEHVELSARQRDYVGLRLENITQY